MKSNYQKVREFHKAFGASLDQEWNVDLAVQRVNLLDEEFYEMCDELDPYFSTKSFNKSALAKELADLLYVTYGTAAAFGIDIDKVFDKVHKNNMTKLGPDGKPLYREDGKVMKPDNYKPIDLETLFD